MAFMRVLRVWRLRLRSLLRAETVDRELHGELAFHFDQLVAEHIDQGLTPAEARQAAHREFGNIAALEESCRDQRRVTWIHDLKQDIVYGLRMLRKQPALTTIATLSLAIGIGANAAVLGAFDALVLQDLPVAHAERLVAIQSVPLDSPTRVAGNSPASYVAFRDRTKSFDAIEMSIRFASDVAGDGPDDPPERTTAQLVTPGWLTLLGIEPMRGRVFSEAESRPYYPAPVVVISHAFWQQRFGGDPGIISRQVRIQGTVRTIIGVMPAEFTYQESGVDYWLPLNVGPQPDAAGRLFGVRARLKPGVSLAQAQAELDTVAAQLATEAPVQNKGWGVRIRPLNEFLFGWTRQPLLTLQAAVAFVLLIACANVAALLLSRSSVRQREVALRAALGAGRWRLMRQLLTESGLLAAAGGVLGLVVAVIGQRALMMMAKPPGSPPLTAIALNANVFIILALLSISTGLVCGLVPAIRGSRLDPMASLKTPGPGPNPTRRRMLPQGVLVSVQLGVALVLLIGSGLLVTSLVRQIQRDLNFDPDGLVRVDFDVPTARYAKRIGAHQGFPYFEISPAPSQTLERVLERLRALPGAESVAGISASPVDAFVLANMDVALEESTERANATYFLVTPNLFHTLRTPIVNGRDFNARDTSTSPWVAVVNETCARRLWPGQNPIGKRFTLDTVPEEQAREVVGVVRDIPTRHAEDPQPIIYASYLQQPSRYRAPWAGLPGQMLFMIRTPGDPEAIIPAARKAIAEIEPGRPLFSASTVASHLRAGTGQFQSFVSLIGVFAAMATLLAAIGTYGVMAFNVDQRTREIGIRRALGAGRAEIVALVLRRAAGFLAAGLVFGLAGALALTRLIASQLWGVTPTDPVTFAGVSLLLVSIALVACVIPARRALSVDPTTALRNE